MKKVKVIFEQAPEGMWNAYSPDEDNEVFILGEGNTKEDARADFLQAYKETNDYLRSMGVECEECEFEFVE